jgi:hypothetical protein
MVLIGDFMPVYGEKRYILPRVEKFDAPAEPVACRRVI